MMHTVSFLPESAASCGCFVRTDRHQRPNNCRKLSIMSSSLLEVSSEAVRGFRQQCLEAPEFHAACHYDSLRWRNGRNLGQRAMRTSAQAWPRRLLPVPRAA